MSVSKVNSDGSLTRIAGGTLYADTPIGSVIYTYETIAPEGFMFPRGQALSRTEYSDLFNFATSRGLLETTAGDGKPFGLGDGSTTFTLPNLNGEFLRVTGTNTHTDQGNGGTLGQHQDATEIQGAIVEDVTHRLVFGYNSTGNTHTVNNFDNINLRNISGATYYTKEMDLEGAEFINYLGTRPTNTSLNAMMKVKQTALPADFNAAVASAVDTAMANVGMVYNKTTSQPLRDTSTWHTEEPINVSDLPDGIYLLESTSTQNQTSAASNIFCINNVNHFSMIYEATYINGTQTFIKTPNITQISVSNYVGASNNIQAGTNYFKFTRIK